MADFMPKVGEKYHSLKHRETFTIKEVYQGFRRIYTDFTEKNIPVIWVDWVEAPWYNRITNTRSKKLPATVNEWKKEVEEGKMILIEEDSITEALYD